MKVLILDDWECFFQNHPILKRFDDRFEIEVFHDKPSPEELINRVKRAEIIIPIRERTKFTKEVLEQMNNVKLIAQTGGGLAHIDLTAANRLNIPVATTPGGSKAVVELIFSFILAFSKRTGEVNQKMHSGEWPVPIISSLEKKTIGIIGLGKIGSGVAKIAKAFEMNVIAWGPRLTKERAEKQGVEYVSLETLLINSHFVTVNVRLVQETKNLLEQKHFKLMKKDAYFINTARGEIINEDDLLTALQEGEIAGAGLDVFTKEPLPEDHPFRDFSNVLLSPHIGWKTDTILEMFMNEAINNVNSYFVDGIPQRIANSEELSLNTN